MSNTEQKIAIPQFIAKTEKVRRIEMLVAKFSFSTSEIFRFLIF